MTDEEKRALGFRCCSHCLDGDVHPQKQNEHATPCPEGCNDGEVTARG